MLRNRGFTIIELLIVIAVISILVGIALPRIKGMRAEANIVKAKGELRTLQTAVESYYIYNNNTYPATGSTWQTALIAASPNMISSALTDPFNGTTQYGYATDGASLAQHYVIYSMGPGSSNKTCTVDTNGVVSESDPRCIYVTSGISKDTQP